MDKHEINVEKRHLSRLPWSPFLAGAVSAVSDSTNLSLALELIPHGTFHQLIDRFGPLNQLDASFYYSNIVCAIEFIHSRGLVSRDIKPENFLVGYDGYLVMTDLGIAEMVGEGGTWLDMGTSHYMPPELIQQGYPVGKAIDWWASGVVLYEMLTQTLVSTTHDFIFRSSTMTCVSFFLLSHSKGTVINRYTATSWHKTTNGRKNQSLGTASNTSSRDCSRSTRGTGSDTPTLGKSWNIPGCLTSTGP